MKHENLVLSNELIKVEHHRERFGKLTLRALALVRANDEGLINGSSRIHRLCLGTGLALHQIFCI